MANLTKAQARKRIEEARTKLMLVWGSSHTTPAMDSKIIRMINELKQITAKLK